MPAHPSPSRDVEDPDDVAELVKRFYGDVAQDDLLGPLFNAVARVDWSEHLPKLTAFWCRALFGGSGYEGNPFKAHLDVHERSAFTLAHFHRWLDLFEETIDLGWTGPNAVRMKDLANRVAVVHGKQLTGATLDRQGPAGRRHPAARLVPDGTAADVSGGLVVNDRATPGERGRVGWHRDRVRGS